MGKYDEFSGSNGLPCLMSKFPLFRGRHCYTFFLAAIELKTTEATDTVFLNLSVILNDVPSLLDIECSSPIRVHESFSMQLINERKRVLIWVRHTEWI